MLEFSNLMENYTCSIRLENWFFFVRFEKKTILFIALLCGGLKMKITNYLIIIVAKANMCKWIDMLPKY